jgi:ribonuclease D
MIHYINTTPAFTEMLNAIKSSNIDLLEVDTETTGFDPHRDKILLVQIGGGEDQVIINAQAVLTDKPKNIRLLKDVLENSQVLLHNAKFDYKFLKVRYGIRLNHVHDTMIAAHLIKAGLKKKGFGLADLLKDYGIADLDKICKS